MVMRRIIILCCAITLIAPVYSANEVKTNILRNPVAMGESVDIHFVTNRDGASDPNLQILEKDFEIINVQKQFSTSIVNGQKTTQNIWKVELNPKRSGRITIPALRFGKFTSETKQLQIKAVNQQLKANNQNKPVYLELLADTQDPYVQQQVKVTLRVWMDSAFTLRGTLSELNAKQDAIIKKIGQSKNYRKQASGKQYNIHEDVYLIHPQNSGELTFQPIRLSADYILRGRRRNVRENSNALRLNVRPIPTTFTGRIWLPAQNLKLSESWSEPLSNFQVGTPMTRSIKLSADRLLGSQLPEIKLSEIENIKMYPGKADVRDQLNQGRSHRTQKFVMIPDQAGSYQLPEINVPWWDVKNDRLAYATLPSRTITVKEAPKGSLIASEPIIEETIQPLQVQQAQASASNVWLWVSVAMFLGWLATTIAFGRKLFFDPSKKEEQRQLRQQAEQKKLSLRKAIKEVEKQCTDNAMSTSKDALIRWGQLVWSDRPPHTLAELADLCQESALKEEIIKLNKALYSNENQWNGKALWVILKAYIERLKAQPKQKPKKQRKRLVELYNLGN